MRRQSIVREISSSMKSFPFAETYLYGSEARGEASMCSDIDLLVLLPDHLTVRERIGLETDIHTNLSDIELKYDTEISVLILQKKVWNSRKTPFTINVLKDRIKL